MQLPIEQYPRITPPTVIVTATFPGASAETMIKTVAAPIEENSAQLKACCTLIPALIQAAV